MFESVLQSRNGRVTRLNRNGLGYIRDTQNGEYAFTFDKILRYRGQRASEIGLREGSQVRFREVDGRIQSIEIIR